MYRVEESRRKPGTLVAFHEHAGQSILCFFDSAFEVPGHLAPGEYPSTALTFTRLLMAGRSLRAPLLRVVHPEDIPALFFHAQDQDSGRPVLCGMSSRQGPIQLFDNGVDGLGCRQTQAAGFVRAAERPGARPRLVGVSSLASFAYFLNLARAQQAAVRSGAYTIPQTH